MTFSQLRKKDVICVADGRLIGRVTDLELDERSVVERNMLQNATYFFEDENILCLKFVDSIVAQGKKDSLAEYLKMVFAERFDCPVEVRALYGSAKESKLKYNEIKLQQEVDAILAHAKTVQDEKKEEQEEKKAEKKQEKKFEKKFERKFIMWPNIT